MHIHKMLKKIRMDRAISLKEFARRIDISEFELAQMEQARKKPTPYLLKQISKAFSFSYADLLLSAEFLSFYKNPEKVTHFFDQLNLAPDESYYIRCVDHLTTEEIDEILAERADQMTEC